MPIEVTRVIIVVSQHWIVGSMHLNGQRIQDVLRDANTNFARVLDVQVYADANHTTCIAALPQVMVPKDRIQLVILPEMQHEAPVKRWNNFSARTTANISAIVGGFYVEGELQLPVSTIDVVHAFTTQLGTFFPIIRASIIAPDKKRLSVPVLFANKRFLNCFNAEDAAKTDADAAELESSVN
ncbi:MAG TPA: hypothetical protein VHK01_05305 [Lacipirellulaceae bacterium]|jgi:hypothetical protein|nr:hypothetical protein [Lacipirellulaceae bacterium]